MLNFQSTIILLCLLCFQAKNYTTHGLSVCAFLSLLLSLMGRVLRGKSGVLIRCTTCPTGANFSITRGFPGDEEDGIWKERDKNLEEDRFSGARVCV